jgi:hypothetical protein
MKLTLSRKRTRVFKGFCAAAVVGVMCVSATAQKKSEQKAVDKPLSQKEIQELAKKSPKLPSGATVQVGKVDGAPNSYTITICDETSKCGTGVFGILQVESIEAVLAEAMTFAKNEEEVGKTKPTTTRFYDKTEPSFIVDVAKQGPQSKVFITMTAANGPATFDLGSIKRADPNAKSMVDELISRIRTTKVPLPK